jgi:hypothetical protein
MCRPGLGLFALVWYHPFMDDDPSLSVAELARERPGWMPVVKAACTVAEQVEGSGGRFAGRWVLDELGKSLGRPAWLPGLRLLVAYGLLEKSGASTRGGARAYYRMPRWREVRHAVDALERSR